MKTLKISSLLLYVILFAHTTFAQVNNKGNITISGTKFTYPLIEKWISEYKAIQPGVQIVIAPKSTTPQPSDIKVIAHAPADKELTTDQKLFLVSKYALLPISGQLNPLAGNAKKSLSKKELDKLFFEESILEESSPKSSKAFSGINIYSREGQACASIAFAEYFGHKPSEIKGKKISGDDIFLLTAIQKDTLGVTFNNLGYIFDLKSRKIKNGISILPVDLKKVPVESINSNIDQAIQVLENNSFETIPVEKVGFVFSANEASSDLKNFLRWIATDGQKYNHDYGFLNLDKETLSNQIGLLDNNYLSSAN